MPDPAASHIPPVLQEARPKCWCWSVSPDMESPTTPHYPGAKLIPIDTVDVPPQFKNTRISKFP